MAVHKDTKRNTWYFRKRIMNEFGESKQKSQSGFRTKAEAIIAEQKLISNSFEDYSNITFQELYDDYIKDKSLKLKPQSLIAIKNKFKNQILPYFGKHKIKDINHKIYIDWQEKILQKNFSYKYNSGLHSAMVSILNYAVDFYNLEKNIASKVKGFSKKDFIPEINFWNYDDYKKFIDIVDDYIYKKLFRVLYFTGMRQGECLALNWNDFTNTSLNVRKTIAKSKNKGKHIITSPKTKSSRRIIELDEITINELLELKEHYKKTVGFCEEWFIFGGLNPLAPSTVGRKKDEYIEKANVKRIKIHEFRHSHASLLISLGTPITVISQRLGHSDITMTLNTYSHLIQDDINKAVSKLNNLEK